jgi:hypothetical protein
MAEFSELLGKIIIKIERGLDRDEEVILIHLSNGAIYKQYHSHDCCESVTIDDINGDLNDLVGYPLLQAEESSSDASNSNTDSATWTFYKMATRKGYVTIRWYGESNGYYSERAAFDKIKEEDPIREQRKKKLEKIKNAE